MGYVGPKEIMEANRLEELKAIMRFISTATNEEKAKIIVEISIFSTLVALNPKSGLSRHVDSVSIIDDALHLNLDPKEAFGW